MAMRWRCERTKNINSMTVQGTPCRLCLCNQLFCVPAWQGYSQYGTVRRVYRRRLAIIVARLYCYLSLSLCISLSLTRESRERDLSARRSHASPQHPACMLSSVYRRAARCAKWDLTLILLVP
jgi:hypothetical protein